MDRIDDRTTDAIRELQAEFEINRKLCALEWKEHDEEFKKLRDDLDREFDIKDREQNADVKIDPEGEGSDNAKSDVEADISGRDRDSREQPGSSEQTRVQWGRASPEDIKTHVDDYMAGRGRDSLKFEQFAANHGEQIEEEFQRRYADLERSKSEPPSSQPPPLEPDPPSYEREPSYYDDHEPKRHQREPEQDHDWEYGG